MPDQKAEKGDCLRERGCKFKGKGKGEGPNLASGRLRPSTTGDKALAAMAGDTEADAKGDDGRAAGG